MSDAKSIGYAWDFNADLGSGRIVSVKGNFPVGATLEEMNAEMDKIRTVVDRQQAKSAIPAVETEIVQLERTVAGASRDLVSLDETNEGKKLNYSEKQGRAGILANLQRHKDNLEAKKKYLEQLRQEAA